MRFFKGIVMMGSKLNKLSIVFPCYNVRNSIETVLSELLSYFRTKEYQDLDLDTEVIVVDDGSTDGSSELLKAYADEVAVIVHDVNKGYGAALKSGILNSDGDIICFFDFDTTCSAKSLSLLLPEILVNRNDMVVGNRIHSKSKMPLIRLIGNTVYKTICSLLLMKKINDACSGYRVFTRTFIFELLDELPEKLNFTLAMTVLGYGRGYQIVEKNVSYVEREGNSKLHVIKDGFLFLWTIFKYRFAKPISVIGLSGK